MYRGNGFEAGYEQFFESKDALHIVKAGGVVFRHAAAAAAAMRDHVAAT